MISYYKYTEGEAFTINGVDYVGFFNVIDGKSYTGKKKTTSSGELIPKQTFISEIYLRKLEFDSNYDNNINLMTISQEKFDIFTKTNLEKVIDVINLNNLKIYKSLVLQNPNFLNLSTKNTFFYGLSSTYSDIRNDDYSDDGIGAKSVYTQIDPFEFGGYWGFLDNITNGTFSVNNNDDFVYFCTDNINTYTVKGSFTDPSVKLTFDASSNEDATRTVLIDDIDLNIFQIKEKSIVLYEYEPYVNCGTLLKKDEIFLQENLLFVKIGNSIRLEITTSDFYIKNKYSNDIFYKINIDSLNLGVILNCQVRIIDDLIAVVSKNNNKFYITYIDPEFPTEFINQFEMLNFEDLTFDLLFSDMDSNIIILTFKEYIQTRFISNSKYPASASSNNNSKLNFNYLKNYFWNTNTLLYNPSNNIKWNSNSLKSNSYNNILVDIKNIGGVTYSMIHNIGRIYVIKKNASEDFKIFKIPKNLPKSFNAIECSDSSFGLYLNNSLKNIVTDTINIFTNNECKIKLSEDGSDIIISELQNIKISIENMFFNGNEQLNVLTLKRIFETIVEIQRKLIS
jgi:hypothetical protein